MTDNANKKPLEAKDWKAMQQQVQTLAKKAQDAQVTKHAAKK